MNDETVQVLRRPVYRDDRGSFEELFVSPPFEIKQINKSGSRRHVLRGLHWQPGQAKLVSCTRGAVLDIVMDVRTGKYEMFLLSSTEGKSLYIPGTHYAHGFLALEEQNELVYACSELWDKNKEVSIHMQDSVDRGWKKGVVYILSDKDKNAPSWGELNSKGTFNVQSS